MWLRENNSDFKNTRDCSKELHFLWKSESLPIYIMDNHVAAAWCWMQECIPTDQYNFFHIDQHKDLTSSVDLDNCSYQKIKKQISLEDYLSLSYCTFKGEYKPLFTWENYIYHTHKLFPNWFKHSLFASHRDIKTGDYQETGITISKSILPCYLINEIRNLNDEYMDAKWIINVDMDYFFCYVSDKKIIRQFSTDYIKHIGCIISYLLPNIQVLTIALSPSCCGGWEMAKQATRDFLYNCTFIESCIEFLDDKEMFPNGWH